jgi:uncharacterized repeat protein (TIGR04052 family)
MTAIRTGELARMAGSYGGTRSDPDMSATSPSAIRCASFVLAALVFCGCSPPQQPVEIPFELKFGGAPLSCDTRAGEIALTDLRFYVHDVRLVTEDGTENPVELLPEPLWQNGQVALLDFENGKGTCTNGTPQTNTEIRGSAPAAEYVGLRFRIGVPEPLNHENPLIAEAPLNYSFMHWHWSTGYKFLRAGILNDADGFWIHLGSSRCEGTASDVTGCRSGNRPHIELEPYLPATNKVEVDLLYLVDGIDLADGTPSDCSSGHAETACRRPLAALGINFGTGNSVGGSQVFRAGSR